MRISIEPETEKEKETQEMIVFNDVFEFALIGMKMENKIVPRSITAWNGDPFVLHGRIHELLKRLDDGRHSK